jgi:hypothetical protein
VRPDGELVVNEVNTFPGFTSGSQYPRMWQAAGLPFGSLLTTLIETALARQPLAPSRQPLADDLQQPNGESRVGIVQ